MLCLDEEERVLLTLSTLGKPKKSDKVKKKKKCRAKINLSGLKVEIAKILKRSSRKYRSPKKKIT